MTDALLRVIDWLLSLSTAGRLALWLALSLAFGAMWSALVTRGRKGVRGLDGERY